MNTQEELNFLNSIESDINIIFDVGCRDCSLFLPLKKEVHYFDPQSTFINDLKQLPNNNTKSVFNTFGLSNTNEYIEYNTSFESFLDRSSTIGFREGNSKIILEVKKAKDYIIDNNINSIDFLKIDTEGFELNVLKGFEEFLNIVNIIQFEYGGTYLDSKITLKEVIDYLKSYEFENFSYLKPNNIEPLTDYNDHYQYSNIICFRKK